MWNHCNMQIFQKKRVLQSKMAQPKMIHSNLAPPYISGMGRGQGWFRVRVGLGLG